MGARVGFEQHLKWGSYWAGAMLLASHFAAQCAVILNNSLKVSKVSWEEKNSKIQPVLNNWC